MRGRAPHRRGPPHRLPLHHRARLQGLRLRRRRVFHRPRRRLRLRRGRGRQECQLRRAVEWHRLGGHATGRGRRSGRGGGVLRDGLVVRGRVVPEPAHVQATDPGDGGEGDAPREHRRRDHVLRGAVPARAEAEHQLQQRQLRRRLRRRQPQHHAARRQRVGAVGGRPEVLPGGDRGAAAGEEGRRLHQVPARDAPHGDAPPRQPAVPGEPGTADRRAAGGRLPRRPARPKPRLHRRDALRHRLRAEDTGLLHVVHGRARDRVHVAGGGGGGQPAWGAPCREPLVAVADHHGCQAHGRVPCRGGARHQPQAAQVPGARRRRTRLRAPRRRRHLPRHGHIPQVAPVAVGVGEGAAVQADELPEAVAGGVHARGAERAPAAAGGGAGALLRAAPPPHVHRRLVLRVRQRGGGRRRRSAAAPGGQRHRA
ncbi:Os01g0780600 [Oryza sativa Japonica Group]|uniref:Os01g0780600 protein n=1 Tax=Oryza sativa subsp. japonica TaxID=39947 RepID=Q0JIS6_ORYSJ|nr:Os01g0780600 [Oryza sativa Japonica Group]|eukprot:NP_001044438.1 Os01g0780600 [Oryza sativa Japonica Group]